MYKDVLSNEAEKLKTLSKSRGLLIPEIENIKGVVSKEDYDLAIVDIGNKFEGIYTLIQDIRSRKFKYEFSTNWNPFNFDHSYECKPFFVNEIEDYGYDKNTSSCKCPENYNICNLNQSQNDISLWSNNLKQVSYQKIEKPLDTLIISLQNLQRVDIQGKQFDEEINFENDGEKDEFCKESDVVLCSIKGSGSLITQWSDWGGCSSKCGIGIQSRMRINYDGTSYQLVKDYRDCEIEKCKRSPGNSEDFKCSIRKIPTNSQYSIANECKCPNEEEMLCSSDEAFRSKNQWIEDFRKFCDSEMTKNEDTNILQKELLGKKREILGGNIKMEFSDGFYIDCSENWGLKPLNDLHIYCRSGSPILCRRDTNSEFEKDSTVEFTRISIKSASSLSFVWVTSALFLFFILRKLFKRNNSI